MVDDLVDTAGTLVKGVEALLEQGAKSVTACATHAVLSGPAVDRISSSALEELVVSNSIPNTCLPSSTLKSFFFQVRTIS